MVSCISNAIFTLDGLLEDVDAAYLKSYEEACAKFGKTFPAELKERFYEKCLQEYSKDVIEALGLKTSEKEFQSMLENSLQNHLTNLPIKPGAEKVTRDLGQRRIGACLLAECGERPARLALGGTEQRRQLLQAMAHVASAAGGRLRDCLLSGVGEFRPPPADAGRVLAIVGSSRSAEAAASAGMKVVVVSPTAAAGGRLAANPGVQSLASLEELRLDRYEMPLLRL